MYKINPCYKVTIFTPRETIIISDPLTCQINVERGVLSDSQKCTVRVTNLSPTTRQKIFKDAFQDTLNPDNWNYIHVEAGYNGQYALIFKGRVLQAYSTRPGGSTDVTTEIQAMYLDAIDSNCSYTFKAGTTKREAFHTIAASIPNIVVGNVGNLQGGFQTDTTFDGSALDCLNKLTGGAAQIDNGVLNCILNNEVIDVPVPKIGDDTGLLDTPMRRDANLEVKMLFQPDLIVNQLLEIQSSLQPDFNGQYKVVGFSHDLQFGENNAGNRTTTVNLYIGPLLPGATITNTNGDVENRFYKVKGDELSTVNPKSVGKWIAPIKAAITSKWGMRVHPVTKEYKMHDGVDLGAPYGTPVKATQTGQVVFSGEQKGYGKIVTLNHGIINGKNVTSSYAHLSNRAVGVGNPAIVQQGAVIGYVGNTGIGTGAHLHFEIRENGRSVDPKKYVKDL